MVAQPPTYRDGRTVPLHPGAGAPPPEAPTADRNPRYGAAWLPRRAPWISSAGCRLTSIECPQRCPCFGGLGGFSLSAPARWASAWSPPSDSGSVGVRPIGGASGPLRAALKTYKKFSRG
jgi:hypothetical protein